MKAFCVLVVLLSVLCSSQAPEEPIGHLSLKSVFINDFLQSSNADTVTVTVTCHTTSAAATADFEYQTGGEFDGLVFDTAHDLNLHLNPHESVECELTETIDDEIMENSHGVCEFNYGRFLAPENNTVRCTLSDGSVFALRMSCDGGCPDPVLPQQEPYCRRNKRLLPTDTGVSHSFHDGSPGFAMYAPNTECTWMIPRSREGVTNFLFSRLDLGSGDVITAYASPDGTERTMIKEYTDESVPDSVSTSEEYLILEFTSDDEDEGLGFAGFYYYSAEPEGTIAITPGRESEDGALVGRKFV